MKPKYWAGALALLVIGIIAGLFLATEHNIKLSGMASQANLQDGPDGRGGMICRQWERYQICEQGYAGVCIRWRYDWRCTEYGQGGNLTNPGAVPTTEQIDN